MMSELTRQQVLDTRNLVTELDHRGVTLIGSGNQRTAKCPFHPDGSPSFAVNVAQGVWKCHAGCGGGSVIDLIAKFDGKNPKDVFKELADEAAGESFDAATPSKHVRRVVTAEPKQNAPTGLPDAKPSIERIYSYHDSLGTEVYQVLRMRPKTFRQRHKAADGSWKWSMDGVTRVLYRLPEVLQSDEVWVTEGEKDADTLTALGFVATCNVGGAGKWLEAYTESLAGKHVVICGDTDKAGQDHVRKVMESLAGKVASIRNVKLPGDFKDASDYAATIPEPGDATEAFTNLRNHAPLLQRGIDLPLKSIAEMEAAYSDFVKEAAASPMDLSLWLPSFHVCCRPLVPGDLVSILAGTAVGKTAILQNIAHALSHVPTVMFEFELSDESMFERFLGHKANMPGFQVEDAYRKMGTMQGYGLEDLFKNLLVCTLAKVDLDLMETLCRKAELKLGRPPKLILVDYIQLMQGPGKSRYERFSDIAEGLRRVAKSLKAAIVVTSQVQRKPSDADKAVSLSDAKESGSIENSSSLVLGAWRQYGEKSDCANEMTIKVLKNTRGSAGREIKCDWSPTMRITESPKQ